MLNRLAVSTIWVKDQNEALRFYTEKLGFEIRADVTNRGYRWLTVGLNGQPDIEFQLAALKPGGVIGVTMWLGLRPLRIWRQMQTHCRVVDQAVVHAAWGGAWLVAVLAPRD